MQNLTMDIRQFHTLNYCILVIKENYAHTTKLVFPKFFVFLLTMGKELQSITQLNVFNRWYVLDQQKTISFGQ
jgi:hypothetical protein